MLSPKGEHKSVEKVHVPAASANPRGSAHQIEFAVQIRKKREHVSRFLHSAREKVSAQELSDDFGTASVRSCLSAKRQFRDSHMLSPKGEHNFTTLIDVVTPFSSGVR